jgi:hypothetical protein
VSQLKEVMTAVGEDEEKIHESVNVRIINGDRDEPSWASLSEFWLVAVEGSDSMTVVGEDEGRTRTSVKAKIIESNGDKPCWASSGLLRLRAVMSVRWKRRKRDPASVNAKIIDRHRDKPSWLDEVWRVLACRS